MSRRVPLIDPAAIKEQVRDGFTAAAPGYDTTGTEFFGAMGRHLVAHAGVRPGAVVLDVGCGKGAVTIPASRASGPDGHVTGLDLALPCWITRSSPQLRPGSRTSPSRQATRKRPHLRPGAST